MSTAQSPPDEANLPITNTLFPPPPSFYKSFTEAKVARHGELRTAKGKNRAHPEDDDDIAYLSSRTLKEEEEGELGNLEEELGKPRVDWVNEDGRWMCFGQMHTVSTAVSRVTLVPFPLHLAFSLSCFRSLTHLASFFPPPPPPTFLHCLHRCPLGLLPQHGRPSWGQPLLSNAFAPLCRSFARPASFPKLVKLLIKLLRPSQLSPLPHH